MKVEIIVLSKIKRTSEEKYLVAHMQNVCQCECVRCEAELCECV